MPKSAGLPIVALLAALGLYFILIPYDLGFTPDSMAYLEVAKNFANGQGITNDEGLVIDHWPPGYPIALSFVSHVMGLNLRMAGKILQPFLLFSFVLLFGNILKKLCLNNFIVLLVSTLLIFSQSIKNFLYFLSEGLFLVFLLLSFYLFLDWARGRQKRTLIFVGISCGFLFLTRYAGIGFVGGYLLFILISNRTNLRKSIQELSWLLFPFIIIVLPWFLYLAGFENNPVGRKIAVHLISFTKLSDLVITLAYWFLGSHLAMAAFLYLIIVYIKWWVQKRISFRILYRRLQKRYKDVILVSSVMIIVYPLFLIFSISFYDSWTPLDNRILSPIFPFILLLIAIFLNHLFERNESNLFYSTAIVLLISFVSSVVPSYMYHYTIGGGYTKAQWSHSEVINFLKEENECIVTYTNGIELGILHVGGEFRLLPLKTHASQLKKIANEVVQGKAQVVYFYNVNWRNYLVSRKKLLKEFQEHQKVKFKDGIIIRNSISEKDCI